MIRQNNEFIMLCILDETNEVSVVCGESIKIIQHEPAWTQTFEPKKDSQQQESELNKEPVAINSPDKIMLSQDEPIINNNHEPSSPLKEPISAINQEELISSRQNIRVGNYVMIQNGIKTLFFLIHT